MATCKDCVHSGICYKEHNHHHERFYYCDLEDVEKECQHFKNKATIIDIPDDTIMYVQDKWLVINMESEDIGKAMKSIVDYCKGGKRTMQNDAIERIDDTEDFNDFDDYEDDEEDEE